MKHPIDRATLSRMTDTELSIAFREAVLALHAPLDADARAALHHSITAIHAVRLARLEP